MKLAVGDERALDADQFGRAGRQIEHVALAQQLVRAHRVKDGAGIHLGRDLEGDAGGDVGLDDAGDHVHAGPLRGHDAVDAGGARHLGDAGDGHFHVGGRDQHQVRQFVNNNDNVAQVIGDDDFLVARHHDFLVQLHGETVGADLDLFAFGREGQFRLGRRRRVCFWAVR